MTSEYVIEKDADCKKLFEIVTQPRKIATVFRGVECSTYKLVPSAYRDAGMEQLRKITETFIDGYSSMIDISTGSHPHKIFYEIAPLIWFHEIANRNGLRVPEIPLTSIGNPFIEIDGLAKDESTHFEDWIEIAALAQHYGIPTRMLDWSYNMETAIYFAIRNIEDSEIERHPEHCFSIWELAVPSVSMICPKIGFTVPNYCDNPNIRAQQGLFSFIKGDDPGKDLEDVVTESIDGLSEGRRKLHFSNGIPALRKINVRYSEIPQIRASLITRGLTHDHYHPNLSDVVTSMKNDVNRHKS